MRVLGGWLLLVQDIEYPPSYRKPRRCRANRCLNQCASDQYEAAQDRRGMNTAEPKKISAGESRQEQKGHQVGGLANDRNPPNSRA